MASLLGQDWEPIVFRKTSHPSAPKRAALSQLPQKAVRGLESDEPVPVGPFPKDVRDKVQADRIARKRSQAQYAADVGLDAALVKQLEAGTLLATPANCRSVRDKINAYIRRHPLPAA